VGNALAQLQTNGGGRFALFLLGTLLIIYGIFALLNSYCKEFPTPPPSRRPNRGGMKKKTPEQKEPEIEPAWNNPRPHEQAQAERDNAEKEHGHRLRRSVEGAERSGSLGQWFGRHRQGSVGDPAHRDIELGATNGTGTPPPVNQANSASCVKHKPHSLR
jgi:hypothetical protein